MAEGEGRLLGGRYRLQSVLGRGGMGIVWRAVDEVLGRDVAVKEVLVPRGLEDDARAILHQRMLREARAAARLSHPGIVTVHDVVEEDGSPWIVMEFVEARTLQDIVDDDGPLPPGQVAEIGRQLLGALRTAHVAGILHRDVKPANVMLSEDRAVLTDFGIAHMEGDVSLTQTGIVMGSPAYISPERAQGDRPGPPADLWALGATLYMAVEGNPPHDREDVLSTLAAVMMEDVPEPKLAGPLSPLLLGLLVKDPAMRLDAAGAAELLQRTDSYEGAAVHAEMTLVDSHGPLAAATEALPTNVIPSAPLGPTFDSLYAPTPRRQPVPAPLPTQAAHPVSPAPQRRSSDEPWMQHLDRGAPPRRVRRRGLGTSAVIGAIVGVIAVVGAFGVIKYGGFGEASDVLTTDTGPMGELVPTEEIGYKISVPSGWNRGPYKNRESIRWDDPHSDMYLQVDRTPWPGSPTTAIERWEKVDLKGGKDGSALPGYRRLSLTTGKASGYAFADVDFTWNSNQGTSVNHGKIRRVRTKQGIAAFIVVPETEWATMKSAAKKVLASFEPL